MYAKFLASNAMSVLLLGTPTDPFPYHAKTLAPATALQDIDGCCLEIQHDDIYLFIVYENVPGFFSTLAKYRENESAATRVIICDRNWNRDDLDGLVACFPRPPAVIWDCDLSSYFSGELDFLSYGYMKLDDSGTEVFCLRYV